MRPTDLHTQIYLDSGDPQETKDMLQVLGFLDGQTTNPSLIARNPHAQNVTFTQQEIYDFYKGVVTDIAACIPHGSVSIEVYADNDTTADAMIQQAHAMYQWIPNAHIKLPITQAGLAAAAALTHEGVNVNMTLCFTQEQAAAVYAATRNTRASVYVSPFDGRLDDKNRNGMDVIENIQRMFADSDGHVKVLAASIRNVNHVLYAISQKIDIVTAPAAVLKDWAALAMRVPDKTMPDVDAAKHGIENIPYQAIDLSASWESYDIEHELTTQGIARFAADWNKLISTSN